jgi:hypothetical protein
VIIPYARISSVSKCGDGVIQRSGRNRRSRSKNQENLCTRLDLIQGTGRIRNTTGNGRCQSSRSNSGGPDVVDRQQAERRSRDAQSFLLTTRRTRGTVTHPLSALSRHLPMVIPWLRFSPTEIRISARNQGSAYCGTLFSCVGQAQHSKDIDFMTRDTLRLLSVVECCGRARMA